MKKSANINNNLSRNTLWSNKYEPKSQVNLILAKNPINIVVQEDILISKKTFDQLNDFFQKHKQLSTHNQSILFLFGPSGCGKISTINFLCNLHGFTKLDEKELVDNVEESSPKIEKMSKSSKSFILKSALMRSMNKIFSMQKTMIILKDLPSKFQNDKSLFQIFSSYVSNKTKKTPLILIFNTTISNETQILKNYDILYKENGLKIDFKGFSEKAIETALFRIARHEESLKGISEAILKEKINEIKFNSNGDLKNSINMLFLYSLSLHKKESKIIMSFPRSSKGKVDKIQNKLLKAETKNDSSKLQKDYGMSLFNVVGKFLYNKRKNPSTNEIKQMTKEELKSGKMLFYFNPKDVIRQIKIAPSTFRCFLYENYLDFYGDIEDVVKTSENFAQSNNFENLNYWKERNEDIKLENEHFNSLYIGLSVMINNYNSPKFDSLKQMSGPKIFKIPEITRNFQKKIKETYSNLINIQKSDLFLNLKAINMLLFSNKNGIGFSQKISKELINEDCFIIENEYLLEEVNN